MALSFANSTRPSLPQAPSRASPYFFKHLTSGQQCGKHHYDILLTLDHNRQIKAYFESLERLVNEDVLDARSRDEACGGRLKVGGGRGAGLDAQAAQ